jgi:hypothetical protein
MLSGKSLAALSSKATSSHMEATFLSTRMCVHAYDRDPFFEVRF